MLKAAFSFGFNNRIVRNGAGVGCFDGEVNESGTLSKRGRQQIVVATDTNKILLQNAESVFHVPELVTCLAVCPIPALPQQHQMSLTTDMVLIGTKSSLTAFDIFNNKTLFHRDMPEGINCIKVGTLDEFADLVIVCGCGTTIWGFKTDGSNVFWTALGDDVNALELCDMDNDGFNELLVGSNGVEIKIFKNASFWSEYDEGDPTVALCTLRPGTFAFGLSSGVVGVYGNGERLWRVKTKSTIASLLPFPDLSHVVCVWNNGKVDIRGVDSGDICCKEQVDGGSDLVAAQLADFNLADPATLSQAQTQLTLVYRTGQVHGLEFVKEDAQANDTQKLMREYGQRKHNLLKEIKNLELREQATSDSNFERSMVPADTNLECGLALSVERGLCLRLNVSNDVPIKAVLLFAEGIFDSECYTIHPTGEESSQLSAYFSPTKDIVTELFIKVFAGFSSETQLHVFEINQVLPKFATFLKVNSSTKFAEEPNSHVEFNLHVRADRLNVWLAEKFIELDLAAEEDEGGVVAEEQFTVGGKSPGIVLKFVCTRNNEPLILELKNSGLGIIKHNNIESAANILQSLCSHLNVKNLECRAHFPDVLQSVQNTIKTMEEKYEVIERLSSNWAERLNTVRECVVRAEDALTIKNIALARKLYVRVAMLNRELVGQHTIRLNSRQELLNSLKTLNLIIEQFSRLRVGLPASKLIQECRKAIAEENMSVLPKLLQFGA